MPGTVSSVVPSYLLMLLLVFASPTVAHSREGEPPVAATDETAELLHLAAELLRLEMTLPAVEALRQIAPAGLGETEKAAFVNLLGVAALRSNTSYLDLRRVIPGSDPFLLERFPKGRLVVAETLLQEGRVSEALEQWRLTFGAMPARHRDLFLAAVKRLLKVPSKALAWDPGVQRGELESFIVAEVQLLSLTKDRSAAMLLTALYTRLDPEAPAAPSWANRLVALSGGDPEALALRGHLEVRLDRPDRALPWYLWAAYTTGVREPGAPGRWRQLATLYGAFGWHDQAQAAMERAGSTYQARKGTPGGVDLAGPAEGCRQWHDWLIDYRPESLIRQEGESWQSLVEDLKAWEDRCSFVEPNPFGSDAFEPAPFERNPLRRQLTSCSDRRKPLPWEAVRHLLGSEGSDSQQQYLERILCTLGQAILPPRGLELLQVKMENFHPVQEPSPLWRILEMVYLRQGRLPEALIVWQKGLDLASREGDAGRLFESVLEDLAQVPVTTLRAGGEDLPAALEAWGGALVKETALASRRALLVARVLQRWDPNSPVALRWADRAIVLSNGSPEAFALRGELELNRGRPDRAAPWMTLASEGWESRAIQGPGYTGLYRVYGRLHWWDRIEAARQTRVRKILAAKDLDLEKLLPPLLGSACPGLLERLADQDVVRLIRSRGDAWQKHFTALKEWNAHCQIPQGKGLPASSS